MKLSKRDLYADIQDILECNLVFMAEENLGPRDSFVKVQKGPRKVTVVIEYQAPTYMLGTLMRHPRLIITARPNGIPTTKNCPVQVRIKYPHPMVDSNS